MENRSAIKCKFNDWETNIKEAIERRRKEIDNYFSINFHINKNTTHCYTHPTESSIFIVIILQKKLCKFSLQKSVYIFIFCVRLLYCWLLLDLVVKYKLGDNRTNIFIVSHIYFIADFFQLIFYILCCGWHEC